MSDAAKLGWRAGQVWQWVVRENDKPVAGDIRYNASWLSPTLVIRGSSVRACAIAKANDVPRLEQSKRFNQEVDARGKVK